jgi:hypothetical protein
MTQAKAPEIPTKEQLKRFKLPILRRRLDNLVNIIIPEFYEVQVNHHDVEMLGNRNELIQDLRIDQTTFWQKLGSILADSPIYQTQPTVELFKIPLELSLDELDILACACKIYIRNVLFCNIAKDTAIWIFEQIQDLTKDNKENNQAYSEVCLIAQYLTEEKISGFSSTERALYIFIRDVTFDADVAVVLKSNCKHIFQRLLREAYKYKSHDEVD